MQQCLGIRSSFKKIYLMYFDFMANRVPANSFFFFFNLTAYEAGSSEQQKRSGHPYESKIYDRYDTKSNKVGFSILCLDVSNEYIWQAT